MKTKLTLAIMIIAFISCQKSIDKLPEQTATIDTPIKAPSTRPNIVFILADDVGKEVMGYLGGQSYDTHTIDSLARNGMQFTNCYGTPLCSPSRVELMTGKYGFRNYTAWGIMPQGALTFATALHRAGYATYLSGKWQFAGEAQTIRNAGFDQWTAWDVTGDDRGSKYRDPKLYQSPSNYIADSLTKGRYGEDIFVNRIINFFGRDKDKPHFAYYTMNLCHNDFQPTPDDPEYLTWNPNKSDKRFFASMAKYMDKKVRQVIYALDSMKQLDNTIIIFAGDNGTNSGIASMFNGVSVQGGKRYTNIWGTNVPCFVYWRGHIASSVNEDLIDFTDFLPTIAEIAQTTITSDFGVIDGHSFYGKLFGTESFIRDWSVGYFKPTTDNGSINDTSFTEWVQNKNQKLYDSTNGNNYYDMSIDPLEKLPITPIPIADSSNYYLFDSLLTLLHNKTL